MIFVGSMTDMLHEKIHVEWLAKVFAVMKLAPWHTYLMLTKRPECAAQFLPLPEKLWLGVTIERQYEMRRWGILRLRHDVAVRFVSVEPMLGPVSFREWGEKPDWIICGAETGPGARHMSTGWADALAAECKEFGIPFFFKNASRGTNLFHMGTLRREFPKAVRG